MSIRRGYVPTVDRYTVVPNDWLRDSTLSFKARGVLAYLLSHREGWSLSMRQLIEAGAEGREAMQGAVRELEEHGYLVRERRRDGGGHVAGMDYVVGEPPTDGNPVTGSPVTSASSGSDQVSPTDGNPDTGLPVVRPTTPQPVPVSPTDGNTAIRVPVPIRRTGSSEDQKDKNQKTKDTAARRRPADPGAASDAFERFWAAYPNRKARANAVTAWRKNGCEAIAEDVIAGALRHREDPNRVPAYTKHPTTWLNGHCWEDDPLPPRSTGSRTESEHEYRRRMFEQSRARAAALDAADAEQAQGGHLVLVAGQQPALEAPRQPTLPAGW